ncbi:MAG TPA: GNAT family N-acetyltransferase [Bacillota bacterium]|nr:GNAT family N-acetyltransferase [Bacillota bacterium]
MLRIVEVKTRKQLREFINFPFKLYSNNPNWVPPLKADERSTLLEKKNPAFEYCYARYWLAYKDGILAGRIAGIINDKANQKWNRDYARFGWFDFIEDREVARGLLEVVEKWALEEGLAGTQGPMGFCDMDKEGLLIEGFEEQGSFTTIYNFPYYPKYLEENGYVKDVDWLEFRINIPKELPETINRIASRTAERLGVKVVSFKSNKEILPYGHDIFNLLNEAYKNLYSVVALSKAQIDFYIKQYFSSINPDFVKIILDKDGELAAFGIGIPSLGQALIEAKGKLVPFGFLKLLKALKKNDSVDLLLVAVRPDMQNKGVNSLLMTSMAEACWKNGITTAYCNPELESNHKVQGQWKYFDTTQHKRRRCYHKSLEDQQKGLA